jgi:hypothetical protein
MYIEVQNGKRFEKYINAVVQVLGLDYFDADIEIEFAPKLDGDAGGYCHGDDEEVVIEIATKCMGEKIEKDQILQNIAHELIHAQQILTGRLKDFGLQIVNECLVKAQEWDGEYYTNVKYADQPWEIDAYGREEEVKLKALEVLNA